MSVILPHQYIVNRGYISATQNILTDIVSIGNYLGPFPKNVVQSCAPSSTLKLDNGAFQWGTTSANNTPIQYYRPIPKVKCVNNNSQDGFHNSSILDYTYFNLVVDQSGNPLNSNVWTNNIIGSGNAYSKSSTPFINILQDGNPTRISYINPAQAAAMPSTGDTPENSFFNITYNTKTPFSIFNSSNPSSHTVTMQPVNNKISIDQWDMTNGGVFPPRWSMIKNEWNIQSRNHVDQIVIMDSINNIYLSTQVFFNNAWMLDNLKYGISPIYYSAYASKILPTMEPFKSLLAGIPIDIIQSKLNIFTQGITTIATTTVTGTSSTGTVSPYSQNISIPAVTMTNFLNKNPIPDNGVVCDPGSGCKLGIVGTGVDMKAGCVAPSCTPSPMAYKVGGTSTTDPNKGATQQQVTIVPAYNGKAPSMIYVPLYTLIKLLWDSCSPNNTTFVIVDNNENNIENTIPDFGHITPNLKIIYRCYFWALNCSNKSIKGSKNLQASAYSTFVTTPFATLGLTGTPDLSYLIDVGAYYKAIYDNTYQSESDYSNMFSKPSYSKCERGCSGYTDSRTGDICIPTSSNNATCKQSDACTPMCNNNFCLNTYPNYTSTVLNTLIPLSSSIFCPANSNASSVLMNYPQSFYKQTKAPPPPMPPGVTPPPRFGTSGNSIPIKDKETFLCEDRGLGNIYRYNANGTNGPTKTKYSNAKIAASYTPGMDITSATWVWSHSLDGTSLSCNKIPLDFSGSITCPSGQNCSAPTTTNQNIPDPQPKAVEKSQVQTKTQPEEEEEEEEQIEDESQTNNSSTSNQSSGLIISGIFIFICVLLLLSGVALFIYLQTQNMNTGKKHKKSSKHSGGEYFYYDL